MDPLHDEMPIVAPQIVEEDRDVIATLLFLRHWSRVVTRVIGLDQPVNVAFLVSNSFLVSKSLLNFLVSYISSFLHF